MIDLSQWEDYQVSNNKINTIKKIRKEDRSLFGFGFLKVGVINHIEQGIILKEDIDRAMSALSS